VSPCPSPLADAEVLDWWTGELPAAEARRVERHLLSCASCSARAQLLPAVAEGVRALVREGRLPSVLAPIVVERLRREGRRIREYRVAPGGGV
jgi:anti-sigma factor RsiW